MNNSRNGMDSYHTFTIFNIIYSLTVDDRDGDVIRCRTPVDENNECGGICEPITGVHIDVVLCVTLIRS